jgi:hypothetical protein
MRNAFGARARFFWGLVWLLRFAILFAAWLFLFFLIGEGEAELVGGRMETGPYPVVFDILSGVITTAAMTLAALAGLVLFWSED